MNWPKLREHITKILLFAVVSTVAMAAYVELRTKEYTAYAEIMIERSAMDFRDLINGNSHSPTSLKPEEVEIELRRITSAKNLGEVIEDLDPTVEQSEPFSLEAWVRALFSTEMEAVESRSGRRTLAHQLERLRENFIIKRDPSAPVISIGYRALDPEMSADMANRMAEIFLRTRVADQRQGMKKAIDDLQRVADEISTSILKAEQETEQYRAKAGLYAIDGVLPVEQRYNRLSRELTEAALDLADAKAGMSGVRAGQSDVVSLESIEDQQALSLIDKLRAENAESGQRAAAFDKFLKSDPEAKENDRLFGQHRLKADIAEIRYDELEKQADQARAELSSSWDHRLRLRELEQNVADLKQSYPAIRERLQSAREQEQLLTDSARIISPATIPTHSSNFNGLLLIGMTLMGSCVAGAGWALLSGTRGPGFMNALDVEAELGQPLLGLLPRVNGIASIDAESENPSHLRQQWSIEAYSFLEGVRSILNSILPNRRGEGAAVGKVVLITSCFPNEGKTTLSLSLIRQAALGGAKAVLIEGDMRKAGLKAKLRTVAPEKGLVDLLEGTTDKVDDVLVSEPESGADLMLAGGPHEDAFALSRSPRLKVVIDDLRSRYDLIVIDCPPVLGVSDTRAMMDLTDEVLFVVQWQNTPKAAANSAMREIARETLSIAGVVLTQVDFAQHLKYCSPGNNRYQDTYEAYANVTSRDARRH